MLNDLSKKRVKELCDQIAKEQDHKRFSLLIAELNDMLDGLEPSLKPREKMDGQARGPAAAPKSP